jgi:hypothetical protein
MNGVGKEETFRTNHVERGKRPTASNLDHSTTIFWPTCAQRISRMQIAKFKYRHVVSADPNFGMATFTCSKCANQWTENYCPVCAQTINRPPSQQPPPIARPASTPSPVPAASAQRRVLELPRRYSYKPSWKALSMMSLSFVICPFFLHHATHNRAGLILNGATLGPTGATVVYWVMTLFMGFICLMTVLGAVRMKISPVLELGPMRCCCREVYFGTESCARPTRRFGMCRSEGSKAPCVWTL